MFIPDDEKDGRKEALKKLMEMMKSKTGEKLGNLKKKPVVESVTIEKLPLDKEEMDYGRESDSEDSDMGDRDSSDISEEDKEKIRELYRKFC